MNIPLPRLTGVGHLIHTRLLHLPLASLSDRRSKEEMGADLAASFDVRPCVRALERNATLIILADGGRTESRHAVTVAGLKMLFAPGPLSMARSTGAALLPAFVVDEPGTDGPASLRLVICPPLELQVTDDPRRDVEVNLRRFARVFEEHILAYPHDFPWHRWVLHTALDRRSQSRQDASLTTPQEARQP